MRYKKNKRLRFHHDDESDARFQIRRSKAIDIVGTVGVVDPDTDDYPPQYHYMITEEEAYEHVRYIGISFFPKSICRGPR